MLQEILDIAKQEEIDLRNETIEEVKETNLQADHMEITKCIFKNCQCFDSHLTKIYFTEIIFQNCDFSNTDFTESSFVKCKWINCKMVGCNFTETSIYQTTIQDSIFEYSIFSENSIKETKIENSNFKNTTMQESKWKKVIWNQVDLSQTRFLGTNLKDIDFTTCMIEGIILQNRQEIQGMIVNEMQALELSKLLGIKIK